MSQAIPTTPAVGGADHGHGGHGHDAHAHNPHLAHHFDTPEQQFSTAKTGMWVFLATEILMFGGLFVAYAVYRANHPEVFLYAHEYLDKMLGAVNTVILLVSSFTMALGVRAAQLGQTRLLVTCLILTLLGGFGFMGIKGVEYYKKWSHNLWVGTANEYNPNFTGERHLGHSADVAAHGASAVPGATADEKAAAAHGDATPDARTPGASDTASAAQQANAPAAEIVAQTTPPVAPQDASTPGRPTGTFFDPNAGTGDAAKIVPNVKAFPTQVELAEDTAHAPHRTYAQLAELDRERVFSFFSIYFVMTGLHGIHVLIGMGLIAWVLVKALGGIYGPAYFTPVDLVGLYWHLVDLIWIFLFPLLYLIH